MSTNVVMPQMGESIAEGTIVRWMKKVGERVDRDEPLFEISTDKVDAEIPSPAAGVVSEIRAKEGDTVPVNTVVAIIGEGPAAGRDGEQRAEGGGQAAAEPPAAGAEQRAEGGAQRAAGGGQPWGPALAGPSTGPAGGQPSPPDKASVPSPIEREPLGTGPRPADESEEGGEEPRSSPLVRRIAREHGIDLSHVQGTGLGGRITKQDITAVVERLRPARGAESPSAEESSGAGAPAAPAAAPEAAKPAAAPAAPRPGDRVRVEPMSIMRKKIAEHMVLSRRTSAHVHSVFEIDYTRVAKIRETKKDEYERAGAKLTYLSFIAKAAIDALRAMPIVNASIDGENIVYKLDINLGIAVALDWGLIVPVVKRADEKNLLGLGRAIADLAERARTKQLKPDDVQGGTFTITNPGVFGAQFGMPIINQPQVAILGVGAIEKRPVVVDEAIAIRPRGYLTLGYDHRLIDGAVADQFLALVKKQLEEFDSAAV